MRTYSLAALILMTIGTGVLSSLVLFAALTFTPDSTHVNIAEFNSNIETANRLLDGAIWFWVVVSVAIAAIVLTAGGVLTRTAVRHHLLCRFGLTIMIMVAVEFALDLMGLHSFDTAIARVNTPVLAEMTDTGWSTLDQHRVLLAGSALVTLIFAIAFYLQIGHDNRGTDRLGIVE